MENDKVFLSICRHFEDEILKFDRSHTLSVLFMTNLVFIRQMVFEINLTNATTKGRIERSAGRTVKHTSGCRTVSRANPPKSRIYNDY